MHLKSKPLFLFSLWNFSLVFILSTALHTSAEDSTYLVELGSRTPDFEGEQIAIVGGTAIAERYPTGSTKPYQVMDNLLVTSAPAPAGDAAEWVWRRQASAGKNFNTEFLPIELSWFPFAEGDDIAPFLVNLKQNLGTTLIWRPPPVNAVMSYIDWGRMHTFKMKAPTKDITIYNVPSSDASHPSTTGAHGQIVSHHRMWHFPIPPTGSLEIGEERSTYRVTFQDADFNIKSPWLWNVGSKWRVQHGGCTNPFYNVDSKNSLHESFYPRIRWYSYSGLIEIFAPGGNDILKTTYPPGGIPVKLHSDFHHTWGPAFFVASITLPKFQDSGSLTPGYNAGVGGKDAIALEISGEFNDASIELRPHGNSHPAADVWLKEVVITDPYSLRTAYPGSGPAKSSLDGVCSSLGNPGFYPGVRGRMRGSAIFKFGGAGFSGFLLKSLHGSSEKTAFHAVYEDIGYSKSGLYTWNAALPGAAIPKIDGLQADRSSQSAKIKLEVTGKFKNNTVHTPLALEWGNDDSAGVDISREIHAEMVNSMLHFMPAPPLIPPTHSPSTQAQRIYIKTTHDVTSISGNPWAMFYSNMTITGGSIFPYSLVVRGARDEHIPTPISVENSGQAFIAENIVIKNNTQIKHNTAGDAPPKIRLGLSNWAPPKYTWFQGDVYFQNVLANGEFLYSPAWGNYVWTLRIDKPLQKGVRFKLGQAQNYSGRTTNDGLWYKDQITQVRNATGPTQPYYMAVRDVPAGTSVTDTTYWQEVVNPFSNMRLIYLSNLYELPKLGAVINGQKKLVALDENQTVLQPSGVLLPTAIR